MLMQLSINSYTNQRQAYQIVFILTYYNMVFKMALYLVLEKTSYFYFQYENILRLFEDMNMIFKKGLYLMN